MADPNLKLKISADTRDAESNLESFKEKTSLVSKAMSLLRIDIVNLARLGFDALKSAIKFSIGAAIEQEDAINKLSSSLSRNGVLTKETLQDQLDFATSLQKTTTFADEQITAAQALIANFGATGDTLKEATKATLDLAAAQGIDLHSASLLVGKAFAGETGTLSRYGIILDENVPKSQKFEEALKKINKQFGGEAEAQAKTFGGQMKQFKNLFGDIGETLGFAVIPIIQSFFPILQLLSKALESAFNSDIFKQFMKTIQILFGVMSIGLGNIIETFGIFGRVSNEIFLGIKLGFSDFVSQAKVAWLKVKGIVKDNSAEIINEENAHAIKRKEILDSLEKNHVNAFGSIKKMTKNSISAMSELFKKGNEEIQLSTKSKMQTDTDSVQNIIKDVAIKTKEIQDNALEEYKFWLLEQKVSRDVSIQDEINALLLLKEKYKDNSEETKKIDEEILKHRGELRLKNLTGQENANALMLKNQEEFVFDLENTFKNVGNEFDKVLAQAFSNIDTETKSLEENLRVVGKAIKQNLKSRIIADSAFAIGKTWIEAAAAAIPTLGGSLVAAVGLTADIAVKSGLAIAAIDAVKFQSGGIVGGTKTSGDTIPARLSSGEMVLNREEQFNLFHMAKSGSGGGRGATININGGIFMSDRNQAKQLAKMIDTELVVLGRQRQRVS